MVGWGWGEADLPQLKIKRTIGLSDKKKKRMSWAFSGGGVGRQRGKGLFRIFNSLVAIKDNWKLGKDDELFSSKVRCGREFIGGNEGCGCGIGPQNQN